MLTVRIIVFIEVGEISHFDAYLVSDLTQTGDSVALALTNQPTNNQECPARTTNDL